MALQELDVANRVHDLAVGHGRRLREPVASVAGREDGASLLLVQRPGGAVGRQQRCVRGRVVLAHHMRHVGGGQGGRSQRHVRERGRGDAAPGPAEGLRLRADRGEELRVGHVVLALEAELALEEGRGVGHRTAVEAAPVAEQDHVVEELEELLRRLLQGRHHRAAQLLGEGPQQPRRDGLGAGRVQAVAEGVKHPHAGGPDHGLAHGHAASLAAAHAADGLGAEARVHHIVEANVLGDLLGAEPGRASRDGGLLVGGGEGQGLAHGEEAEVVVELGGHGGQAGPVRDLGVELGIGADDAEAGGSASDVCAGNREQAAEAEEGGLARPRVADHLRNKQGQKASWLRGSFALRTGRQCFRTCCFGRQHCHFFPTAMQTVMLPAALLAKQTGPPSAPGVVRHGGWWTGGRMRGAARRLVVLRNTACRAGYFSAWFGRFSGVLASL